MGRPSDFTQEVLEAICDRLAQGEPLTHICRDEGFPSDRTVRNWMKRPEVASAIACAREIGFDVIAAECLAIADHTTNDTRIVGATDDYEGHEVANHEWISRSKLRVETRLKLLAKWDPKRYGDKVALTGGDPEQGDQPIQSTLTIRLV